MKSIAFLLIIFISASCSRNDDTIIKVSSLSSQSIEIKEFELLEFSQIPFSGIIDQWKIGNEGFTILANSVIYHYTTPSSQPIVFNSEEFLELQGCIISDFAVSDGKLYTLCEGKGIALSFDLENRQYRETLDLQVDAAQVEIVGGRAFVYQTPNTLNQDPELNFQLLTFPVTSPNQLKKYLSYPASLSNSYEFNVLTNQALISTGNSVIFSRMLNDSIINLSPEGDWISTERLHVASPEADNQPSVSLEEDRLYFPLYMSQSKDWRLYTILKNGSFQTLVHHLPSGKKTLVDKLRLPNEIQLPLLGQLHGKNVFVLLTEEAFMEFNQNESYPEPFQRLKNYEMPFVFLRIPLSELPA
jgi:hypothetical protein